MTSQEASNEWRMAMTTTIRPASDGTHDANARIPVVDAGFPTAAAATGRGSAGSIAVVVLRLALGFTFLWPFLDKTFGLGFSTSSSKSWLNGGSPTNGFLANVRVGPLQSAFRGIAGNVAIDWLFMLALLGVGVALLLGVVLRIAAISGSLLLILMWAAEWPMAQSNSAGAATGSTNPFLDYHLIYAIGLVVVAALGTASVRGLGKWWCSRPMVAAHPIMR
jgi:thiosulfate dehydrogenase [quinone] large subunit